MAFTFDPLFAADPSNAANVASNASIVIFNPADAGKAPITITDVTGAALPNPITVNKNGFGPAFVASIDRVAWSGGGFTGYFTSYEGMKQVATDAQTAAEAAAVTAGTDAAAVATAAIGTATDDAEAAAASAATAASNASASATAAANAAALVGAPADSAVQTLINATGSATRGALNATYATTAALAGKADTSALAAKANAADLVKGAGSTKQIGAFVNKLKKGVNAATITALGDSTGASPTGWLIELVRDKIGPAFPAYTVKSRDWQDAYQKYSDAETVHQVGTAGLRRLVSTGASTDRYFTVADSTATSPTSELDARFRVMIPALGAAFTLGGKYDTTTNNRAWFVTVNANGTISLFFSTDGTAQFTRTSTVTIPPAAVGLPVWIRTTFDTDDGAGSNVARFYYSTDNTTWTQIGSTVTNAGATAIFDAATPTQFNSRSGSANSTGGAIEYYAFQLYSSLTANTRPVIDLTTDQWNGYGSTGTPSAQFTDYVGNTVQVAATGSTGVMVGAPVLTLLNGCVPGQTISYANDATRFPKLTPVPSDLAVINFSHNEIGLIVYRAPYKQLADALIAKWPDVGIIANAQNPRKAPATNLVEHSIRIDQINALAASQGYALVDAYNTIAADMNLVLADGIHPTDAGYDAIRDVAYKLFNVWI